MRAQRWHGKLPMLHHLQGGVVDTFRNAVSVNWGTRKIHLAHTQASPLRSHGRHRSRAAPEDNERIEPRHIVTSQRLRNIVKDDAPARISRSRVNRGRSYVLFWWAQDVSGIAVTHPDA